jgi:hypothetical protein
MLFFTARGQGELLGRFRHKPLANANANGWGCAKICTILCVFSTTQGPTGDTA